MLGQVYLWLSERTNKGMLQQLFIELTRQENIQLMSCISEVYSEQA